MNAHAMQAKPVQRRHDLDWLRVLAFVLVFLYHSGRFFDSEWWHLKNATSSALVDALKGIFDMWGMALIFLISGASIFFALRPGRATRLLRDRVSRLLVPLAFGILVLAPPQVYLERLTHGEFRGSFLEFLPLYFRDWPRWNGNFAWSGVHLWYLEDLFLFTLVLLPLFAALKADTGRCFIEALGRASARPGVILLWALPFALMPILFDPLGIVGPGLPDDLTRLVVLPPFMIMGFLVFSDGQIQQTIIHQRNAAVVLALLLTLATPAVSAYTGEHRSVATLVFVMVLVSLLIWSTILGILGYGMHCLTRNNRLLAYSNEAVLPFYILHQPVILILGYFVTALPLPILAKYLIIAALAFGVSLGLYEYGVRRWNPVRRLLGLKLRNTGMPTAQLAAQPAS